MPHCKAPLAPNLKSWLPPRTYKLLFAYTEIMRQITSEWEVEVKLEVVSVNGGGAQPCRSRIEKPDFDLSGRHESSKEDTSVIAGVLESEGMFAFAEKVPGWRTAE